LNGKLIGWARKNPLINELDLKCGNKSIESTEVIEKSSPQKNKLKI
jgi:hypothetical protein